MREDLAELLRSLSAPMSPIVCGVTPKLSELDGIRAVLFDVYGTLLVSAGGDIGSSSEPQHEHAMHDALEAVGIAADSQFDACLELLRDTVEAHQTGARDRGAEFPEVDILAVWRDTLDGMSASGLTGSDTDGIDVERLAVEYEWRANPVAPMPNAEDCLEALRLNKTAMVIVSNALFFTPVSLEVLLGADLDTLGFDSDLCFFSYANGVAKPGPDLFELAVDGLGKHGIEPNNTLFVGNDAYKDIAPSAKAGFRTALFAGDKRSLKPQPLASLEPDIVPDLIVTDLAQIPRCIRPARL